MFRYMVIFILAGLVVSARPAAAEPGDDDLRMVPNSMEILGIGNQTGSGGGCALPAARDVRSLSRLVRRGYAVSRARRKKPQAFGWSRPNEMPNMMPNIVPNVMPNVMPRDDVGESYSHGDAVSPASPPKGGFPLDFGGYMGR